MLARAILLCLTLACYASLLMSQPQKAVFIGTEEGLSQGMVYCLLQSRDGFIWIATKDGLNRYDGYRFEIFTPNIFDPFSIASGEIQTIFEDSRGWLWVCYIGGIDIFDPASKRFFHLPVKDIEGFRGYRISFWEDGDGTMWIAARRGILKVYSFENTIRQAMKNRQPTPSFKYSAIQIPVMSSEEPFEANSIFRTKAGNLLVATTRGIYALDTAREKLSDLPVALPGFNITFFGEDNNGRLWFRSRSIVCCISKLQEQPDFIRQTVFNNDWILDSQDNIWSREGMTLRKWVAADLVLAMPPQLEQRITENTGYPEEFYLTSLLIDRSGNIWAGTSGYGVVKYLPNKPNFRHCQPKFSHRNIYEDPSGRFLLLRDLRVIYADKDFKQDSPNPWFAKVPAGVLVKHITFDVEGNCWLNTNEGRICRIDAQTQSYQCFEIKGHGVWFTAKGEVITLSEQGMTALSPEEGVLRQYPFARPLPFGYNISERYTLFYEGCDSSLWLFAYEGLIRAMPSEGRYIYEHYLSNPADPHSLSNNVVFSIAEDPFEPRHYLWVGTKGGGLNRLDLRTGKFQHFTTAEGLPDNVIYGILPDRTGNLWLSTNKGLCRFSTRDFSIKRFTTADGLQSNEFNQGSFLKTRDGTMIFGGVNGLTVFHPDSLQFNQHAPPIEIVEILINNQAIDIAQWTEVKRGAILSLSHHQNLVSIGFAALDYTNPTQNRYRYQLFREGVLISNKEEKWIDIGTKNSLQFSALQPGLYILRVLGSNNDGVWSNEATVFRFYIAPPWWASFWAYVLYALIALSAVAVWYRYQMRQRLAQQEAMRLRELDEFKSRFFTNITHEFRTPLTVILGVAEQIEAKAGKEVRPLTRLIQRSGQTLLRLVSQILDLAKLEAGTLHLHYIQADVLAYLRYIVESLQTLANVQHIILRLESTSPVIIMDYDPERLLHVVYNLLSNAIKFTPPGDEIVLKADILEQGGQRYLQLRFSDTGIGIPEEDLPHIFKRFYQARNAEQVKVSGTGVGLALTQELVKAMGGSIKAKSAVGKGTEFVVVLPISNHAAETSMVWPGFSSVSADLSSSLTDPTASVSPNCRLLIIEDNPHVVDYLKICLQKHYHLDVAYNGASGIEKATESVPDLIVCDVMMPEKDGFEVCEILKNDERTSHIPIVLLSAKADVESRVTGLRRGADAYIFKPFHREELLATLANLIDVRRRLQTKYSTFAVSISNNVTNDDPENAFLQKARQVVLEHIEDPSFHVAAFCRAMAMSQPQLHRKLTALTNQNASRFIRAIRLARAKELLAKGDMNVTEVAFAVGFDDPKYFSRVFTKEFGVPPSSLK